MTEFELIDRFFVRPNKRNDVDIDIGDDAAVCRVPADHQLVLTTDLFVAGVHFPDETPASKVGHKALAISLSDLAAMGASPAWFTLNLSLPEIDEDWLSSLSQAMFSLADDQNISLVGGDTVRGPLSIGIQACGFVPTGAALLRSGAQVGDQIFVTGLLGDAAVGLRCIEGDLSLTDKERKYFESRLHKPAPRVAQGIALRGIASAMIDISDGLVADLGHILASSNVGATIHQQALPLSESYRDNIVSIGFGSALTGGDDYELCFTVAAGNMDAFHSVSENWNCPVSCIGKIESDGVLRIKDDHGKSVIINDQGYDHFSKT